MRSRKINSVSLALATLGVWTPSPRFIQPAIALSIAYVGVENLVVKDPEKRWRITLRFGFIHGFGFGFGFAGALVERHLPRARLPLALFGSQRRGGWPAGGARPGATARPRGALAAGAFVGSRARRRERVSEVRR